MFPMIHGAAEHLHDVDCEVRISVIVPLECIMLLPYYLARQNSTTQEEFYWVVKDADDPNSNGYPHSYLLAPVNGVPEHGNPNPDYYMAFVNKKAIITPNKLYADKFLIQKS